MAFTEGLILTNKGKNLYAKAQTGKLLKIKKVVLGDGILENLESIENISQLKNKILDCDIKKFQVIQNEIATITFYLNNQDLETGFYWRELGVIVEEPDTQEEILYCYGNAGENGEYISAGGGADILEKNVSIDLIISNVKNITAIINKSLLYASQTDIEELTSLINTKSDKKKIYNCIVQTNWEGQQPYAETINVQGIKETDIVNIYPIWSEDIKTRAIEREEYSKISMVKSKENNIELICDKTKPNIALNIRIEVVY